MPAKKAGAKRKTLDEGGAISAIGKALGAVADPDARNRVLRWAISAYGSGKLALSGNSNSSNVGRRHEGGGAGGTAVEAATELSELLEQTDPQDQSDRALVVSFWLEANKTPDGFASQAVNDELKNMGHPIKNITDKLDQLIAKKPALIRQVAKSGKTRQARKKYKLTDAGKKRIQALLRGEGGGDEKA